MTILEILMGFLAGLILIFTASLIFKMRMRTEVRLIVNALAGIVTVVALNFFHIVAVPLNLFNALLVGFLGVPGIVLICLVIYL